MTSRSDLLRIILVASTIEVSPGVMFSQQGGWQVGFSRNLDSQALREADGVGVGLYTGKQDVRSKQQTRRRTTGLFVIDYSKCASGYSSRVFASSLDC